MADELTNIPPDSLQYRRDKAIWMPMYWHDYFGDTKHLDCLEHGAYVQLLGIYWIRGGPIPNDDKFIQKAIGLHGNSWRKISKTVKSFFHEIDGYLHHKRVDLELLRSCDRIASAKRAACVRWSSALPTTTTTTTTEEVSKKDIAEPAVQPVMEGSGKPRKKRELGHRIPPNWSPTLRHYAMGEELGIGAAGVDSAAQDMRLWAEANAHRAVARKSNWDATFSGWLRRNSNGFNGGNGNGSGGSRSLQGNSSSLTQAADRLIEAAERGDFQFTPRPSLYPTKSKDDIRLLPKGSGSGS